MSTELQLEQQPRPQHLNLTIQAVVAPLTNEEEVPEVGGALEAGEPLEEVPPKNSTIKDNPNPRRDIAPTTSLIQHSQAFFTIMITTLVVTRPLRSILITNISRITPTFITSYGNPTTTSIFSKIIVITFSLKFLPSKSFITTFFSSTSPFKTFRRLISRNYVIPQALKATKTTLSSALGLFSVNGLPKLILLWYLPDTIIALQYACAVLYIAAILKPLLTILSIAIPMKIDIKIKTTAVLNKQKTYRCLLKTTTKLSIKIGFKIPKILFFPTSLLYQTQIHKHAPSSITGTRKHDPLTAHLTAFKQLANTATLTTALKLQQNVWKLETSIAKAERYVIKLTLALPLDSIIAAQILGILLLRAGIEPNPGPTPLPEAPFSLDNIHIAELNAQNDATVDPQNKQHNVYLSEQRQHHLLTVLERHENHEASTPPLTTLIKYCYEKEQPNHANIGLAAYQALRLCLPPPTLTTLETLLENNAIDALLLDPNDRNYYYAQLQISEDMIKPQTNPGVQTNAVPLSVTTWNCNKTLRDQYIPIAEFTNSIPNSIVCIQETKTLIKDEKAKYIQRKFPGHKLIFTSRPDYKGKISAGVLLAVPLKYTTNIMKIEPTPDPLRGYYIEVRFATDNGTALTIIGAYRPPRATAGSHNYTVRNNLLAHLTTRLQTINHRVILLGDWNADPSRPRDHDFTSVLSVNNLSSIFTNSTLQPPPPSFRNISRIDDIYCRSSDLLLLETDIITIPQVVDSTLTTLSDHSAVNAQLTEQLLFNTAIPAPPAATNSNPAAQFVRPIPLQALGEFKHKLNIELNTSINDHNNHIKTLLTSTTTNATVAGTANTTSTTTATQATNAINESMAILEQIYELAHNILPKTQPRQERQQEQQLQPQHPSPPGGAKTFLPKATKKKFNRALLIIQACKKLQMAFIHLREQQSIPSYLLQALLLKKTTLKNLKNKDADALVTKINKLESMQQSATSARSPAIATLMTQINKLQHQQRLAANEILKKHRHWEEKREEREIRKKWTRNQRLTNKEILQPNNNTGGPVHAHQLRSMQHPMFAEQATTPLEVIKATTFFH